jgi:hypothetical protein
LDLSVQEPTFGDSREISREFFLMGQKIVEFCPKSANLMQEQGSSREFAALDPSHSKADGYGQNQDGARLKRELAGS